MRYNRILFALLVAALIGCVSDPEEPGTGRIPEARLSALTVSTGTLNPVFSSSVTEYTMTTDQSQLSLTAIADNLYATVQINTGTPANSASAVLSLSNGLNTIRILVSDETGYLSASRLYTLRITRTVSGPQLVILYNNSFVSHNSTNDFGLVGIGTTNMRVLTISNGGSADLGFPAGPPRAHLGGSTAFSLAADLPASLAPGASFQLTIQAAPVDTATHSATLTITNNESSEPFLLHLRATGSAVRQTVALWGFDGQNTQPTEGAGILTNSTDGTGTYFTINGYITSGGNPGTYARIRRLHATEANYLANNSYIELQVDLTGAADPRISFDLIREDGAVYTNGFAVHYSSDGSSFTELAGSATNLTPTAAWQTVSWEGFPAALDGQPAVHFRIYGWGNSIAWGTYFGMDTIKIEAYQ